MSLDKNKYLSKYEPTDTVITFVWCDNCNSYKIFFRQKSNHTGSWECTECGNIQDNFKPYTNCFGMAH